MHNHQKITIFIVYNKKINKIYKNLKEASEDTKISTRYLKKACITEHTEWFYMNQCARVKLSESGKLFIDNAEDNPNPSITEM